MPDQTPLQSFNTLNKSLNNTNTFLLDISIPTINYLRNKNDDFHERLKDACQNNRRFASGSFVHDVGSKTDDFLCYMVAVLGCDCCPERNPVTAEFHQEIAQSFREYCLYLLGVVDEHKCDEKIAQLSGFSDDYRVIKTDLLEGRVDRVGAEAAMLWWLGAVPDSAIQEAIVQLRYDYIRGLLKTR